MRTQAPKTKWLIEAETIESLKALYRKLAFTHHPDLGGNTPTMQEINAEYEYRLKLLQSGQNWKRQNTWGSNSNSKKNNNNNNNNNNNSHHSNGNPGGSNPNSNGSDGDQHYGYSSSYQNYTDYDPYRHQQPPPPPPPSTEEPDPKDAREAFEKVTAYASKSNPWFHVVTLENGEVVAYGRTYPHKDFLRDTGFWWDPERRVWHFVRKPFSPFEQSW
jgi:hypothetical protein